MNKDKQIDEMAKDLYGMSIDTMIDCEYVAEELIAKGYRKASDVAEEIFAEIDKLLAVDRNGEANLDVRALAELKKKYTEGEG